MVKSRNGHRLYYWNYEDKDEIKKNALIIQPISDHNGAFDFNRVKNSREQAFLGLLSLEYNIRFVRVNSIKDLRKTIFSYYKKKGKIDYLLLGGHGNPNGFNVGNPNFLQSQFSSFWTDFNIYTLINFDYCLAENAIIWLNSCSVGDLSTDYNFADHLAYHLPGRHILSSTKDTSTRSFELSNNQHLLNLKEDAKPISYWARYIAVEDIIDFHLPPSIQENLGPLSCLYSGRHLNQLVYFDFDANLWIKAQDGNKDELLSFLKNYGYLYERKTLKTLYLMTDTLKRNPSIIQRINERPFYSAAISILSTIAFTSLYNLIW